MNKRCRVQRTPIITEYDLPPEDRWKYEIRLATVPLLRALEDASAAFNSLRKALEAKRKIIEAMEEGRRRG